MKVFSGKLSFCIGIICCFPLIALSQAAETKGVLPVVSPASPEQASLGKFGNYTVDLFHGLPEISIPLYEIKSGNLTLPISISYHASGIKVNELGSWVGAGWSVNAGPNITRKVMGLSDLKHDLGQGNNFLDGTSVRDAATINPNVQTDLDFLWKVDEKMIDAQPDLFYYNLQGKRGTFFFNQTDNLKPVIIPFDPVKINMTGYGDSFKITDTDGTIYDFGTIETTDAQEFNTRSAWLISHIYSSNQQDAIDFSYTSRSGQISADIQDYVIDDQETTKPDASNPFSYTSTPEPELRYNNIQIYGTEQKINEITFANGKVVFNASAGTRLDGFAGQKSLQSIEVLSKDPATGNYFLIKKISFVQSYFPGNVKLKLDRVEISDKNGNVVEKYQFDYNSTVTMPDKLSRERDFWGYYNGKPNNSLVPRKEVTFHDGAGQATTHFIGSAVINGRDPDPTYMQACILKRIYYPTGGYTDFDFETNQYKDANNNTKLAGGLRIKTIKSYDGVNPNPLIKTYKYGNNAIDDGYGRPNFFDPLQYMGVAQGYRYIDLAHDVFGNPIQGCQFIAATMSRTTWYANPTVQIEPYDGAPVVYKYVTEYIGDATNNTGKTEYEFTDHADLIDPPTQLCYQPIVNTFHMDRGQLKRKSVFRKNLTGSTYTLLTQTENLYQDFGEQVFNKVGLVTFKKVISQNSLYGDNLISIPANGELCPDLSDRNSYSFVNYNVRSTYNRLTQTTATSYDESNSAKYVRTITNYSYENAAHMLPTKITTTNSKGETLSSERKYSGDYPAVEPYTTMINKNIIDKVIQEKNLKNTTQISLVQNKYEDQGNTNYLPAKIEYQSGSNPSEARAKFNKYDSKGNVLEMQKPDDLKSAFQWGYAGMYPVVEVKNAANDYNETIVTDQQIISSGVTAPANQTNTTSVTKEITVTYTGTVTIKLGTTGTTAESVTGSIIAFGATTNLAFALGGTNSTCESNSTTTFSNIAPGTYSITISLNNSHPFGFCGTIYFPGNYTHTVVTGTKDFFYNGFEEDNTAATANPGAGKRYKTGDYAVGFERPNQSKVYYVSYHYLEGGKWNAKTKVFTDYMILTEGDAIDEVRVIPNDAQIVTYTYEPLIGITSKCDVNNHLVFYNYDAYGRLRTIKDEDGNILKLISYKYADTEESASISRCASNNCTGLDANGYTNKKCVNGSCEIGVRVNYSTTIRANGTWRCRYYYRFSDDSTLPENISSDPLYIEINATPCDL